MAVALTIIKKTPIHCVASISGGAGSVTLTLATDLLYGPYEVADTPVVNIMGMHWSAPAQTNPITVVRDSVELWTLYGAHGEVFNGWQDTRQNTKDIVITLPTGSGTLILELIKVSGYNNTLHKNPQDRI